MAKGVVVWSIARRPYALYRLGTGARETFVYLADVVPRDLVLVRIRLPPKCSAEEPALTALPAGWDAVPIAHASMQFGTWWVQEGRSLVLYVPSALVREESNAVLNPNHPEFRDVRMEVDRDFD